MSPAAYARSFIYRSTIPEAIAELAIQGCITCYFTLDRAGENKLTGEESRNMN